LFPVRAGSQNHTRHTCVGLSKLLTGNPEQNRSGTAHSGMFVQLGCLGERFVDALNVDLSPKNILRRNVVHRNDRRLGYGGSRTARKIPIPSGNECRDGRCHNGANLCDADQVHGYGSSCWERLASLLRKISTRSDVHCATPAPKKSASSAQIEQERLSAAARIGQSSSSRPRRPSRAFASRCSYVSRLTGSTSDFRSRMLAARS
jgi:hypothetical protein